MGLTATTPPAVEPVSLIEAKRHVRAEADEDNAYLDSRIVGARTYCENYTGRALITQTLRLTLDGFPGCSGMIRPPRPRLIEVSEITYVDTNGVTQALDPANYQVDASTEPGRIAPAYGLTWPSTRPQMASVSITYTAGYGATAASVPQPIREAMLLLIGHRYEFREPVAEGNFKEIPMAVASLLAPYRMMEVV